MSRRLWIAAKAPRSGLAKTRLAGDLGDAVALDIYRGFLRDLAARLADAPFPLGWYVTPADAWDDLAPLVGRAGPAPSVLDQGAGDWTVRQRRLLRGAAARGEGRVVLISSDSPQVRVETIEDAFAQLERRDVVLGPVLDGGYYLIGMRGWHDVLDGVVMSTSSVYQNILARCQTLGCSVGLVETLFDVDRADELSHLVALFPRRDDLSATRAALERHGLYSLGRHAASNCHPERSEGSVSLPDGTRILRSGLTNGRTGPGTLALPQDDISTVAP